MNNSRRFRLFGLFLLVVLLAVSATKAQQAQTPATSPAAPAQQPQSAPAEQSESAETLHLLAGRSLVITSPARIQRVSVADPTVIDAVAVSTNQILINGKAPGACSLVVWDETGQSQTFDVLVDRDIAGLSERLHEALPNEPVEVQVTRDVVTLSGHVSSQAVADRITAIAQAMVPRKEGIVSLLQVPVAPPAPTTGEVLLQVKFADMDRTTLSQLGANFMSLPPAKNIFSTSTQQFAPPTLQSGGIGGTTGGFSLADLLNVFVFRPDLNLAATIKALEAKNLLQILAEPNVLSETGKQASFLAGGEFPFPVVQNAAGGIPVVTVQFREFGVKIVFTPIITADGLIHLKVAPEVSSLDFTNALTLSGFTIPSLSKRSVESEMILKDGQSFAIAGLVNNQVTQQLSKIPGIGNIPIFGKLFQSRTLNKSRDELLVMVTPHIVHPETAQQQPPDVQFPSSFLPPLAPPQTPSTGAQGGK